MATRSQNHGTYDTPLTPRTEKMKCTCRNNIENSEKRTYSQWDSNKRNDKCKSKKWPFR